MSYNKGKAEREWLRWKTGEETKMRQLGVEEETIQRLHNYDWEAFKAERRFFERQEADSLYLETQLGKTVEIEKFADPEGMLQNIESKKLYLVLRQTDPLTLKIVWLKTLGYTGSEISRIIEIPEMAINNRMARLRKKIKNIL